MTAVVRTVRGDVAPAELGVVDAHDHLMIVGGPAVQADGDLLLDDVDDAVAEATAFRDAGGSTIVDAMPSGCGRDAVALEAISRRADVHVIATAGFHKHEYYGDLHWARRYDEDRLVQVLGDECRLGIDRYDSAGPRPDRTGIRPGVLKIATGYNAIRPLERRWLRVVAAVHRDTQLPVITHADHGTAADRQLEALAAEGVPPERVALGHVDRNPDLALHEALAASGAWLSYDGVGRERYHPVSTTVALVVAMAERGNLSRILLGADIARRSARRAAGGTGIAALLRSFVPRLRAAGLDAPAIEMLTTANPARFLTFQPATPDRPPTNRTAA